MTTDEKLDRLLLMVTGIAEVLSKRPSAPAPAHATASGSVAPDSDLDSEYGNFTIKKDPPRWKGTSYAGCKLSETEPEFLDNLASFKDWQTGKNLESGTEEDNKKATYTAKDAARARGWAARLRAGWKSGASSLMPTFGGGDSDDIPFARYEPI